MNTIAVPPRKSSGPSPLRKKNSIRRSTNLDVTWPKGIKASAKYSGHSRDILTLGDLNQPTVLASDGFEALISPTMQIESLRSNSNRSELSPLIGMRCGRRFRQSLSQIMVSEDETAGLLHLLLDDIVGAALVSSAAWLRWDPSCFETLFGDVPLEVLLKSREGVCIAHSPGFTAQNPETTRIDYGDAPAVGPRRTEDPYSWHSMETQEAVGFRRIRRIDVIETDQIIIDSEFQDSTSKPDGGRSAVHEYGLKLAVDPISMAISSIDAEPRVLPYPECPFATSYLSRLVGTPLADIRESVHQRLAGTEGCTHLNDAMRALADVPALLSYLQKEPE